MPVLFAADVDVVAAGAPAGFGDRRPVVDERTDAVANDFRAVENFRQLFDGSTGFDDVEFGGLDSRDVIHHLADFRGVAARGDEGDVVFAQKFCNEAP